MIRHDDPGSEIPTSILSVHIDTDMHNVELDFGFTKRSNPGSNMDIEITYRFK